MSKPAPLQYGFSQAHPAAILEAAARARKAEKILRIVQDQRPDLGACRLLEIGCGAGHMTRQFATVAQEVVAVDIDMMALAVAQRQNGAPNITYALMDAQRHALPAAAFDVIVCNHIYEHVPDARRLIEEILRLLKPGGLCYFGAANRLAFMEPHYQLPLLSVVPKWLAHHYVRRFRAVDTYYETHLTVWGLRALVAPFRLIDYTERVVSEPAQFAADDLLVPGSLRHRCARFLVSRLYWLCPTYLWILQRE